MTNPTEKLAFAYQTIAALEAKIKEMESRQLQQDVEEFIAAHLREDPVTIDQYIDVDDLRAWMAGHVRVPVEFIEVLDNAPYINPSNYDHDQVCELNSAVREALAMLNASKGE